MIRLCLPALMLAALATSCTGGAVDSADLDPTRAPLGKADAFGSCQESSCDGMAPDGVCWCDDQCATYGDCCEDKVESCDADLQQACGGFAGTTCPTGQYCHYEPDATCGWADATGVCMITPDVCVYTYAPVCGCDGNDYGNSCDAHAAGTSVHHDGPCEPPAPRLCLADSACDPGQRCDTTVCHSNCPDGMICPQVCWGECAAAPAASCQGACGEQSVDASCWCDDACELYGDCCDDVATVCI